MTQPSEPTDGPQIGDTLEGQILVAVGMAFTFTEAHEAHQATFEKLNEWLNGIRLYELEDDFDCDANFWDELQDAGYEVGEGEVDGEKPGEVITVFDVWVNADEPTAALIQLQGRLQEFKESATELLPLGLRTAVASHKTPLETRKLIAHLAE